ncbi:phage tail domain-containing protein [Weissella viridescens]|uniref:phage tail domain-containing protein n=1 Tax=Weissella viridescens TaxID=1629 RepID=UPI003528FA87
MASSFEPTLIVERLDGTKYDLGHEGIRVISFDPPSPAYQHTYTQMGHYGAKRTNTVMQQVVLPLTFDVYAENNYDYELQRLKVLKIFDSQTEFYIYSVRMPYLRWRVIAQPFSYPRLGNYWKAKNISISLDCPTGFAETSVTSSKLLSDEFLHLGFQMDIDSKALPQYQFSNISHFNFENIGRIPLLADENPVVIKFKGNAPNGLTLINHTTNQKFQYFKPLTKSNTLELNGLIPIVDGKQNLGNGNSSRSYLDFKVGKNSIEIVGTSDFNISFETRFYF